MRSGGADAAAAVATTATTTRTTSGCKLQNNWMIEIPDPIIHFMGLSLSNHTVAYSIWGEPPPYGTANQFRLFNDNDHDFDDFFSSMAGQGSDETIEVTKGGTIVFMMRNLEGGGGQAVRSYERRMTNTNTATTAADTNSSSYSWQQRGQEIHFLHRTERAMTVNEDGTVLAIKGKSGTAKNSYFQVYRYVDNTNHWETLGASIHGFVSCLASSKSGLRIASAFYFNSGRGGSSSGGVSIYGWTSTGTGTGVGGVWRLEGTFHGPRLGRSIAMNADGTVLAIGGDESKVVIVQRNTAKLWEHHSTILPPIKKGYSFGMDVALSGKGTILAVGETLSGYPKNYGRAYVFHREDTERSTPWKEVGYVEGTRRYDQLGRFVALNEQGTLLAASTVGREKGSYVQLVDIVGCVSSSSGSSSSDAASSSSSLVEGTTAAAITQTPDLWVCVGSTVLLCFVSIYFLAKFVAVSRQPPHGHTTSLAQK